MYLPRTEREQTQKDVQIEFRGYNHNLFVQENEFFDEQNMTGKYWPVMSPRGTIYQYRLYPQPAEEAFTYLQGMIGDGNGNMLAVDDNEVFLNGISKGRLKSLGVRRTLVPYGGYVAIFPDKYIYNWNTGALEEMERHIDTSENPNLSSVFFLSDKYGNAIVYTSSGTAPANPADGEYWVDTSSIPGVLKRWSAYNSMWSTQPTTYVAITIASPAFDFGFSEGDGITITNSGIQDFDGDYVLEYADRYTIVVKGFHAPTDMIYPSTIVLDRTVPDMDFVCAHNNRLWGCSNTEHEIYACKLGDPKNWRSYAGISTDSYALTIPEETKFTGCAALHGSVLFFKEQKIYKIYGTKPANYQLSEISCAGVCSGGNGSIAQIDEVLYYAGSDGVYAYDGSIPRLISGGAFERDWLFKSAAGGTDGKRYYVCLERMNEVRESEWECLFEYNPASGLWSRWQDMSAWNFVEYMPGVQAFIKDPDPLATNADLVVDGSVYGDTEVPFRFVNLTGVPYVETDELAGRYVRIGGAKYKVLSNTENTLTVDSGAHASDGEPISPSDMILCFMRPINVIMAEDKETVPWYAETGDIAYYDTNRRYISKLQVRTELEQGSTFKVALQYDQGPWEDVYTQNAPNEASARKTYVIPIIPHRCDTVRMKFYGTGGCKIFAVSKHYEQGSEL